MRQINRRVASDGVDRLLIRRERCRGRQRWLDHQAGTPLRPKRASSARTTNIYQESVGKSII